MNLQQLLDSPLDGTIKGIPPSVQRLALRDVGKQNWNLLRGDLPLPQAILKQSALAHNSRWMRNFLAASGALFCPHGKTTMAPQLFARQLADGAWGITLATMQQVRVARQFGVQRILLANQLTCPVAIRYILDELQRDAELDFYCLVDSVAGVELLAQVAQAQGARRPLQVLVELGVPGQRAGVRGIASAVELARVVQGHAPWLELRGVEGFEGVISAETADERSRRVREYLRELVELARQLWREHLFSPGPFLVTAGGSSYFDLVANGIAAEQLGADARVVVRSGCYLTHDSAVLDRLYQDLLARDPIAAGAGKGLQPALEVWSRVQSRPEPTRVILTMGKRDVSFDADLPRPTVHYRTGRDQAPQPISADHRVIGLNDQHALVDVPPHSPLAVGDLVGCGISHPCTTFDRWEFLSVVNDEYDVVEGIRTLF